MSRSLTPPAPRPPHTFRTVFPVLALCWLAVFFDGMDVNIYGAVMPHMLDDTGLGLTPHSADPAENRLTLATSISRRPSQSVRFPAVSAPMSMPNVVQLPMVPAVAGVSPSPLSSSMWGMTAP